MVNFLIEYVYMNYPAYNLLQYITCPLDKVCNVSLCDFLISHSPRD